MGLLARVRRARSGGPMRLNPAAARHMAVVAAAATLIATTVSGAAAAGAAPAPGPVVKLIVAQNTITVQSFRGRVFFNPGIWVASLNDPLVFRVKRASYTKPITITQLIQVARGVTAARRLPGSVLDGFNGL